MPADDLVLNVRQIEGYTAASSAIGSDALLIQRGGLGGPYLSIDAQVLVGTALSGGGNMNIAGALTAQAFSGGLAQFSNLAASVLTAQTACFGKSAILRGIPIATLDDVAATVTSFNARTGDVCLALQDLLDAGGAPNFSPVFGGEPRAPTPASWSNSSRLATTGFVHRGIVEYIEHLLVDHPFVFTFNGRSGDVVLTAADLIGLGPEVFDSPQFTGVPTSPTPATGTNTDQIATTAFVNASITAALVGFTNTFAPLDSPQFTGFPSGPTAPPGSSTGQFATTAFVENAVAESTAGVASFNGRTGIVTLTGGDVTGAGGALTVSPVFTGTPQGPTAAPGTTSAQLATTAFVMAAIGGVGVETFNGRAGNVVLTTGDITGAGGAPIASAALTGVPTAPTAAPATSTTQIATTAFVMNQLATGGVTSFNTRTGAITLLASDISAAGGATLVSPIFTGVPQAPTAAPSTSTAQIATCAFVAAAIAGAVSSFNGRTGAITLTSADVSAAGGAPINSPTFTGTPRATTPTAGDNSTALATTAYVLAAIAAGSGVSTFNGRAGAVTLSGADVSAAGGALLVSPAFSGIPTAPTAAANTNTTQLATTAYVMNALSAGGGVTSFNSRAGAVTLTHADVAAVSVVPTATTFTVSGTGTYTPPAGVRYIRVRMVAGGGGGGGIIGVPSGSNGSNSSFLGWTALGGAGGAGGGASGALGQGGAGGTGGANATGNLVLRLPGGVGGNGQFGNQTSSLQLTPLGGNGGSTPFGSGPVGRAPVATPAINNGAGGTGGVSNNATIGGAGGGGGGEYVEFYVATPTSGAISVGAGGAGGPAGSGGVAGAAGSPGLIIVEEFYT